MSFPPPADISNIPEFAPGPMRDVEDEILQSEAFAEPKINKYAEDVPIADHRPGTRTSWDDTHSHRNDGHILKLDDSFDTDDYSIFGCDGFELGNPRCKDPGPEDCSIADSSTIELGDLASLSPYTPEPRKHKKSKRHLNSQGRDQKAIMYNRAKKAERHREDSGNLFQSKEA